MINRLFLLLLLLPSYSALALGLDAVQLEMASSEQQLRQLLTNKGKYTSDYKVQLQRIDFPDRKAKFLPSPQGELLISPTSLSLMPGQSDYLRFQYLGAADAQERYYRVTITEQASGDQSRAEQGTQVAVSTRVESILIVRPRKIKLDYQFENGRFSNTGNGYVVIQVDEDCGKKELITHYLAPGRQYILPKLKDKSIVSILLGEELKPMLVCDL